MDIDSIFVESIAAAVKECLSSIKMKNQVVSLPTFAVETPHLVLAKAHIMSSMRSNGESSIILRFNVFLGSHGAAFRPEIGVDRGIVGQVDHVSAAVLCEIAMPLLNLCLSQEIRATDDPAAMQAFLDRLAVESHEIQFQVELIKRFVEQAGQADKAPALPRPAMNLIP